MAVARVHVRATALADVLVVAAVDVTARGQVHRFGLAAGSGLAAEAVAIAGRLVRRTFRAAARLAPGLDVAGGEPPPPEKFSQGNFPLSLSLKFYAYGPQI